MTSKAIERESGKKSSGVWVWVAIALVLSAAALAYFHGKGMDPFANRMSVLGSVPSKAPKPVDRERLRSEIASILEQTTRKDRQAYEKASQEIGRTRDFFDRAEAGIAPTIAELCSFKGCATLCYLMAKDKVCSTTEADARIGSILEKRILTEVLGASREVENALARLNDTLASNGSDMRVRLASLGNTLVDPQDTAHQEALKGFLQKVNDSSGAFTTIALSTTSSSVGLGITALSLNHIYRVILRVLDPIAAKMGTTTSLALASAAADGPLPIGDIFGLVIEIGVAAWCAYDLYHAQITLKNELQGELSAALARCRQETLDLGKRHSDELLKAYHEQNSRTAGDLAGRLS